jgi:hypothetical protein
MVYLVALGIIFSTSYEYFELDFIWILKMPFKFFNWVIWFLTLQPFFNIIIQDLFNGLKTTQFG